MPRFITLGESQNQQRLQAENHHRVQEPWNKTAFCNPSTEAISPGARPRLRARVPRLQLRLPASGDRSGQRPLRGRRGGSDAPGVHSRSGPPHKVHPEPVSRAVSTRPTAKDTQSSGRRRRQAEHRVWKHSTAARPPGGTLPAPRRTVGPALSSPLPAAQGFSFGTLPPRRRRGRYRYSGREGPVARGWERSLLGAREGWTSFQHQL